MPGPIRAIWAMGNAGESTDYSTISMLIYRGMKDLQLKRAGQLLCTESNNAEICLLVVYVLAIVSTGKFLPGGKVIVSLSWCDPHLWYLRAVADDSVHVFLVSALKIMNNLENMVFQIYIALLLTVKDRTQYMG